MLYIIRGIPGSGKTTLAETMYHYGMADYHVEADQFMVDVNGQYKFDPSRLKECHQKCQDTVRKILERDMTVVVSNTFTRKWEMEPYLEMTDKITVIVCQGQYQNTHGVPDEVVERMKQRFEY